MSHRIGDTCKAYLTSVDDNGEKIIAGVIDADEAI
jgi:hypothetical protein